MTLVQNDNEQLVEIDSSKVYVVYFSEIHGCSNKQKSEKIECDLFTNLLSQFNNTYCKTTKLKNLKSIFLIFKILIIVHRFNFNPRSDERRNTRSITAVLWCGRRKTRRIKQLFVKPLILCNAKVYKVLACTSQFSRVRAILHCNSIEIGIWKRLFAGYKQTIRLAPARIDS